MQVGGSLKSGCWSKYLCWVWGLIQGQRVGASGHVSEDSKPLSLWSRLDWPIDLFIYSLPRIGCSWDRLGKTTHFTSVFRCSLEPRPEREQVVSGSFCGQLEASAKPQSLSST